MKHSRKIVQKWVEEIYTMAMQSTTCSYIIPYEQIHTFDPNDKDCQYDVREYLFDDPMYDDNINTMDFNNKNEYVVFMWYEPPKKEIEEVKKMKKYTIENYEEFSREALDAPPIEEFEDGTIDEVKWYKENKIIITKGKHQMEIDYTADNVNELDGALREMYEVEMDRRVATIYNTVGSEYRPAELKDILRVAIQNDWEDYGYKRGDFVAFIRDFVKGFDDITNIIGVYDDVIYKNIKWYNNIFQCNFGKLDMISLRNIDRPHIQKAIEDLVCTDKELLIGFDNCNRCSDITFIMDNTFKSNGELIGWFYGEQDDDYIDGIIADYRKKLFGEEH